MDEKLKSAVYRDPGKPVQERVENLLSHMTLEEKIAQLGGIWGEQCIDSGSFSEERARAALQHGIGHISRMSMLMSPEDRAAIANSIQRFLIEETRLGIPAIVHEESCAGYLASRANCFPMPIALAATFEPELIDRMGSIIREQMRSVGAHQTLAPVVDVARDARWGRVEETFGEDPYLVSRMGVAYVQSLQTGDLSEGIACTGKHYAGYSFSEGGLNWAPSHIPERELLDVFVAPYAALIAEADVASIMNAYQEIDGIPCGASKYLLDEVLRGRLGFKGNVVSDYFTLEALYSTHHIAASEEEAARLGIEAGLDVELPARNIYHHPLQRAIERGDVNIALVDRAVRRVLKSKFELGLFEKTYVDIATWAGFYGREEDRKLSRLIAQKSIVLLKNENGLLPLSPEITSLAVIGPAAVSTRLLQGDYHFPAHHEILYGLIPEDISAESVTAQDYDIRGSAAPVMQKSDELSDTILGIKVKTDIQLADYLPDMVTILNGIQARVSPSTRILQARGCDTTGTSRDGFQAAIEAAETAEVAVVAVGGRSGLAKGNTSGEACDAADLGLTGVQQELIEAIIATGTPTVVVLINGRPLALPWIAEHVPALLEAWLPGEEGGNAVADVLFGDVNPAGRLPVTLARDVGQMPVYYNHKPTGGRSMFWGDYSDMPVAPLYPFGHGLSYTTFDYRDLVLSAREVPADGMLDIRVSITNSGTRSGDEVVQLYLCDLSGSVTRPVKELKGFRRITLEKGETRLLTFHLDMSQLAFHGRDMRFAVEPGEIRVMVGASSEDIRLEGNFIITGERRVLEMTGVIPTRVDVV
jgi:beta-glucosidase